MWNCLLHIHHRRKPQNLTPPLSSDSANSLSPRASPSATKRPSGIANGLTNGVANGLANSLANVVNVGPAGLPNVTVATDDAPAAKKQRISHYRRPSPPSSGYATTSSGERHASDNEDDRTTGEFKQHTYNIYSMLHNAASFLKQLVCKYETAQ